MNFTSGLRRSSTHDNTPKTHRHANAAGQPQHARLVNLMPCQVLLGTLDNDGKLKRLILSPAGEIPRLIIASGQETSVLVRTENEDTEEITIPIVKGAQASKIGPPLSTPQPGALHATSRTLAECLPGRSDFIWPEDQIHDVNESIIGAWRLERIGNKASTP